MGSGSNPLQYAFYFSFYASLWMLPYTISSNFIAKYKEHRMI